MGKSFKYLIGLFVSISTFSVMAQFHTSAFWKYRKATLKFSTAAQSTRVLNCSNVVTIQALNTSGVTANVASPVTINLSATSLTFYSDSNCATPVSSVTIPTGSSSVNFYFVSSGMGSKVITASASNYPNITQNTTTLVNSYIWIGNGGDSNWNNPNNWFNGTIPGTSDQVIFNEACVGSCDAVISATASVAGVRILSGYTGTITQNASQNLTVGAFGWYQEGSTFTGGAASLTLNGAFTLAGGTFTSSATDTLGSSFTLTGGTFSAASSSYVFNGRGSISTGSSSLNNVTFTPGNGATYVINGTMNVNGNLTLASPTNNVTLSGGTIDVKGDVTVSSYGAPGTTVIKLSGTGTQNLNASTAVASRNLPSITIASTGPVNLSGNIYITGNYLYSSSGTFSAGTSKVFFSPSADGTTLNMGPVSYYDVGYNQQYITTLTADMNVSHSFTLANPLPNAGYLTGPGKIYLQGDLILDGAGEGLYGSIQFVLNGNSNQNISVLSAFAYSPGIEINSTGGTITFPATFTFNDNFKYVQGTVVLPTTAKFAGHDGSHNILQPGNLMFNDVIFNGVSGNYYDITAMNIGGNMSLASGTYSVLTGSINLYGNLSYTSFYSFDVAVTFKGSGAQTLTSIGGTSPSTSFNVNKTGGSLKLVSALTVGNSAWTQTSGGLDMNGFNLSVGSIPSLNGTTLTKSGGVLRVGGSVIGTGSYYSGTIAP